MNCIDGMAREFTPLETPVACNRDEGIHTKKETQGFIHLISLPVKSPRIF